MRTRLCLLLTLACASCAQSAPAPSAEPAPPKKWEVRYYQDGVVTVRNTQTGSCYVGLEKFVYGGTSVALTPAKSLGDCE